jgi:hypothetical protein
VKPIVRSAPPIVNRRIRPAGSQDTKRKDDMGLGVTVRKLTGLPELAPAMTPSQSELLLHPLQQPFNREALSGLRGLAVNLGHGDLAVGMDIEAQEDYFGLGGSLLLTYSVLRHGG